MTWRTWGRGSVDVPIQHSKEYGFSFLFQAAAPSVHVTTETFSDYVRYAERTRFHVTADGTHRTRTRDGEIILFDLAAPPGERLPDTKSMTAAFEAVARSVAQYTAANMLSNVAAVIANYPMSPEAKNQIVAALVMALPNFDDSEALKSPVGKGLVRTREDFIHAAVSARFRHQTTVTDYLAYDSTNKIWDAT